MKELSLYKYGLSFLLLLNVAVIAFFFLGGTKSQINNSSGQNGAPHDLLHLDKAQKEQFFHLVDAHQKTIKPIHLKYNEVSNLLFTSISNDDDQKEDLKNDLLKIEGIRIASITNHFEEIKSILRDDQLKYFESFMSVVTKRIQSRQNKREK